MALTTNKNYLQPTGFKFILSGDAYKNLQFFAQSVTHPGANANPVELPVARVTSVPLAGDKITYSELSLEVLLDEDMQSYKEIQSWLERTVNDGQVNDVGGTKTQTYSDITLIILTSHNNNNVQIKYNDCVPTNIGQINMTSNTGDVVYPTFTVGFRFSSFEIK